MTDIRFERIKQSVSEVTDADEPLFHRLLATVHWSLFPLSYEGSFAFYNHRAGYFPMKFYDGKLLAVFYSRKEGYSVLRPLGQWHPSTVVNLATYLFGLSQRPVSLLKLTYRQYRDLSSIAGFYSVTESQNLAELGDDRYPQLVIPIHKLMSSVENTTAIQAGGCSSTSYLRRILRIFERHYGYSFTFHRFHERHMLDVERVIAKWKSDFLFRYRRDNFKASGDDRAKLCVPDGDEFLVRPYQCLLHRTGKIIDMRNHYAFVGYLDDEPVSFLFLSRTSANCAALYANLATTAYRGLPYYSLYRAIQEVSAREIDYLNLGGQETNSLRRFYSRFNPFSLEDEETRCYDLRYDGASEYPQSSSAPQAVERIPV